MASYTSKKNNFGKSEIRPIKQEDIKKFRKNEYSQPMPSAAAGEIITWAMDLVKESYNYKKVNHAAWYKNSLDYYTTPSLDEAQRAGRNNGVDKDQDTEVMVPALIKRYVDLGAFWLVRQIFKSEPFMQFTSYAEEDDVRKAQKLYERKLQGDTVTYAARDRATQLGIDLFLYGNAVAKVDFTQERMVVMEVPDPEIEINDDSEDMSYDPSLEDGTNEDVMDNVNVTLGDPFPQMSIIDQYGEFKPIYLGHFIIDPIPSGRDWRKANYMGDVEYLTIEEIVEKYGDIPEVRSQLGKLNSTTFIADALNSPFGKGDKFLNSWYKFSDKSLGANQKHRKLHTVTHLYTKYTETCIINNEIVVYHRFRSKNVSKAGMYPYVFFNMPKPTGGLFSVGYGHVLRTLQLEQIILASKRLQTVEDLNGSIIQYVGDAVDEDKIKNIGNLTCIAVDQPGAISELVPNHDSMTKLLDAESRNFERSREYCGIPGMLDGTDTKTHLGAAQQRMEASQVQFDVILDNVRDGFKEIFNKIHVLNMAYLEGELSIKGGTGPFDQDYNDNVLSESELSLLATQPDLSIQLNLGMDVGADKLKAFASLLNVQIVNQTIAALQQSNQISPDKMRQLMGMLFDLAGLTEFRSIFESPPQQAPMDPNQMGGGAAAGAVPGQAPEAGGPPSGPTPPGMGAAGAAPPQGMPPM